MPVTVLKYLVDVAVPADAPVFVSDCALPSESVPVMGNVMPVSLPPDTRVINCAPATVATPPDANEPLIKIAPAPGDCEAQILTADAADVVSASGPYERISMLF